MCMKETLKTFIRDFGPFHWCRFKVQNHPQYVNRKWHQRNSSLKLAYSCKLSLVGVHSCVMGLQITWQVVHVAVPLWVLEGSLPPHLIRFRTDLVQHLRTWAKRKHVVSGIGILFCRVPTYFKCITSIVYKALCHWTGWGLIHASYGSSHEIFMHLRSAYACP